MSRGGSFYSRKSMLVVVVLILVTMTILAWKEYTYRRPSRTLQPKQTHSKLAEALVSGFVKDSQVLNEKTQTAAVTTQTPGTTRTTTTAELVIQTQSSTPMDTESQTTSYAETQTQSSTLREISSSSTASIQVKTTVRVDKDEKLKIITTSSHRVYHVYKPEEETEAMRASVRDNQCVTLRSSFTQAPICIYPIDKDIYISKLVLQTGTWESENMNTVGKILNANRNMTLFDIGCNIGVFTIMAAGMGHRVVAVDANRENLALLTRSLKKGRLHQHATLVWNALAEVRGDVTLHGFDGNIGGTYVKPAGETDNVNASSQRTATAILMDDLIELFGKVGEESVFMKIDIETYEWNAFQGGEYFLRTVDVRYILIEWMSYTKNQETGNKIIQFLTKLHYTPYDSTFTYRKLNVRESSSWNKEVLWIKELKTS